ncbi:MAG TPA: hypothetical protein VIX59_14280 [Candidatus Binataceae bacterium]
MAAMLVILFAMGALAGCGAAGGNAPASANAPGAAGAVATGAAPAAAVATGTGPAANAPTVHAGDLWTDKLREGIHDFKVDSVKEDGSMAVDEWGNQIVTTSDWNILTWRSLTYGDTPPTNYQPALQLFPFPLTPGKHWSETSQYHTPDMSVSGKNIVEGKVGDWGQVTVPAGTYRALRVDTHDRVIGRGGAADEIDLTYWYVPEVNRWVKYSYRGTAEGSIDAEMVSYHPAAAAP